MIGSVAHPRTRALHRSHARRYRMAWIFMIGIVGAALLLTIFGYFGSVDWMTLGEAVANTTLRLASAYGIALVLGVSIALLVGWSPFADVLFPFFDVLQNIPSFALIPLFIYFFGFTSEMIIFFAVILYLPSLGVYFSGDDFFHLRVSQVNSITEIPSFFSFAKRVMTSVISYSPRGDFLILDNLSKTSGVNL